MTDQVIDKKEDSIFQNKSESSETPNKGEENQNTPDPMKALNEKLSSITDENGRPKYADVNVALEALKFSQDHIKTLESENKTLKETKTEMDTFDKVLEQLSANNKDSTKSEAISAETIKQLATQVLLERETAKSAETNKEKVSSELVKKFGTPEKAREAYDSKSKELGLTPELFEKLAETSPQAVLAYFSAQTPAARVPGSQGTINTEAFTPRHPSSDNYVPDMFKSSSSKSLSSWREIGELINN